MSSETVREAIEREWRGVKIFACRLCQFESEVEAVFRDHLIGAHPEPQGGPPTPAATEAPIVAAEPAPASAVEPTPEPTPDPSLEPAPASEPTREPDATGQTPE